MKETFTERVISGLLSAILAAFGVVVAEAVDFWVWDVGWVEAESFGEYIQVVWFLPVGFALLAFVLGVLRGGKALEFEKDVWTDIL